MSTLSEIKILIAEDEPIAGRLLAETLTKWGYQVIAVDNGLTAWEYLSAEDPPTIAILDWLMPGVDGAELCRRVRALNREPYIYLMLLSGKTEQADIVDGLDSGADEYLTKPFHPMELNVRLQHAKRILELQKNLISARERMREMASLDPLTQIWNRRSIMDMFKRELSRAEREKTPLGVLMVDLDYFKEVNDAHGHLAGDEVLCGFVRHVSACLRPYDALGRYGGEEFLVLIPNCGLAEVQATAERLRQEISRNTFVYKDYQIQITASLGFLSTEMAKDLKLNINLLIQAADRALYRAKGQGRNQSQPAIPADFL